MQTIKEQWIKIYLLDDKSMLDVIICATKDYLPSCDNNKVFHIPASFKLSQVNPYLATMKVIPHSATVAHQNQVHHTLDLAITSTCKWVWAISTKKNPSKTTFHLIYGKLSMLEVGGMGPLFYITPQRDSVMNY